MRRGLREVDPKVEAMGDALGCARGAAGALINRLPSGAGAPTAAGDGDPTLA